jgi:hypothetical protein
MVKNLGLGVQMHCWMEWGYESRAMEKISYLVVAILSDEKRGRRWVKLSKAGGVIIEIILVKENGCAGRGGVGRERWGVSRT